MAKGKNITRDLAAGALLKPTPGAAKKLAASVLSQHSAVVAAIAALRTAEVQMASAMLADYGMGVALSAAKGMAEGGVLSASNEVDLVQGALAQAAEEEIATLVEGDMLPPVHPGEILAEDFLPDAGLSPIKAAQRMGVPRTRIERLVSGQVSMTPDTALRLERLFGASAEYWMNLQTKHDLDMARAVSAPALEAIEPVFERPA